MASSPLNTTSASSITFPNLTTPQNLTLTTISFVARGITYSIKAGNIISIDSGAQQEFVYVSSVSSNVITGIFTKTHSAGVAVQTFFYDQARSGTIPDGSTPQGVSSGLMFLWNGALNSGNGGIEIERSAAGELDGATGNGSAVAAAKAAINAPPLSADAAPAAVMDELKELRRRLQHLQVAYEQLEGENKGMREKLDQIRKIA